MAAASVLVSAPPLEFRSKGCQHPDESVKLLLKLLEFVRNFINRNDNVCFDYLPDHFPSVCL